MKKIIQIFSWDNIQGPLAGVLLTAILTGIMLFIGRNSVGEAVIALLYLVPITWCTRRWGLGAGVAASTASALMFDFFFIPPFDTFSIGSLEGWLVLIIFLVVAVGIIGQIQTALDQTKIREREAYSMYEIVADLNTLHSRESIAHTLASKIQEYFQAKQTRVLLYEHDGFAQISYHFPENSNVQEKPAYNLVIYMGKDPAGEISIWKGQLPLPSENNWLLQSFVRQTAIALERVEKKREQWPYPGMNKSLTEWK